MAERLHSIPVADSAREHVDIGLTCWCRPSKPDGPDGDGPIIHNAVIRVVRTEITADSPSFASRLRNFFVG